MVKPTDDKVVKPVIETVYTKDYEEIEKMYNMILEGQSLETEFENGMIKDFNDLLAVERNQKDTKMNELFKQLQQYENQEKESS